MEKYFLIGDEAINYFSNNNLVGLCSCFNDNYPLKSIESNKDAPNNSKELSYKEYLMIVGMVDVLDNIKEGDIDEVDEDWFYENIEKVAKLSGEEYNPYDVVEMINK